MKLKELLGDAYREDMTAGELLVAVENLNLKTAEEAEAREKKLKEAFDKASSDLAQKKKELKELMENEEQGKSELERLQEAIQSLEADNRRQKREVVKAKIKSELNKHSIGYLSAFDTVVDSGVFDEEDRLTGFLEELVGAVTSEREETEKRIKKELMENNPKPPASEPNGDFEDLTLTEQFQLKAKDPERFARWQEAQENAQGDN